MASANYPPEYYSEPTFPEFIKRVVWSLDEFGYNFTKYPLDYGFAFRMLASFPLYPLLCNVLMAVGFTGARFIVTYAVSLPLAAQLKIQQQHMSKWPETVWKFIAYTVLWSYTVYVVVLSGRYDFFQNPLGVWQFITFDEEYFTKPIPSDINLLYTMQLGFYLHSVFATIYLDIWRKDSVMMLFHHVLTICLLQFSFLIKYYQIGSLVLLLHDVSDILLEFTKLHVYLKDRDNSYSAFHDWCANILFVIFSFSWALFRLYWFPLKVLYASTWGVYVHHKGKDPKMFLFFNAMLFALQALHIYWFYFVILLLVRVATGKQKEVDDTREYEEQQQQQQQQQQRQHAD